MVYENVVRLCRERKVSIHQLEVQCGIGNGTIGGWKTYGSIPRVDTVKKIADYFGETVDDLLREKRGRKR